MNFDYDLVVVGATAAAQRAALRAVRLKARVAWVTQTEGSSFDRAGFPPPFALDPTLRLPDLTGSLSLAGVDVLADRGEFQPQPPHPQVVLIVGDRVLRSRFYLLAPRPVPILPPIATLDPDTTFTSHTLSPHPPHALPRTWLVLGSRPQPLAWAAWLRDQGHHVCLHVPATAAGVAQPLPGEDPEVNRLCLLHWEAQGIRVTTEPIAALVERDGPALATDAGAFGFLGEEAQTWVDMGLGLDRLGLSNTGPIAINRYGQSAHPQIYACGGLVGGYDLPVLAAQEAAIAVDHALGQRPQPLLYAQIPYLLPLDPPVLRVGLTEAQARQFFRRRSILSLVATPLDPLTGETRWAKVILQESGRILGFHGVGTGLEGLLALMAGAIGHRIPLPKLGGWAGDCWSYGVVMDWGQQWQDRRLSHNPRLERQLRWFFNWQRTGNF